MIKRRKTSAINRSKTCTNELLSYLVWKNRASKSDQLPVKRTDMQTDNQENTGIALETAKQKSPSHVVAHELEKKTKRK